MATWAIFVIENGLVVVENIVVVNDGDPVAIAPGKGAAPVTTPCAPGYVFDPRVGTFVDPNPQLIVTYAPEDRPVRPPEDPPA